MKCPVFEVYQRVDTYWDWRLRARNHKIIATSHSQGYRTSYEARRAITALLAAVGAADVVVVP